MAIIKELRHCKKNFDAWSYNILWPQENKYLPLLRAVRVTVEDVKFAYNAWSLLRLCLFYGVGHPHILSDLAMTTPPVINPKTAGHYSFDRYAVLKSSLNPSTIKIGLNPSHPRSVSMYSINWSSIFTQKVEEASHPHLRGTSIFRGEKSVELVLGMEHGMSSSVADQCDILTFIPQEGSIGSLSMLSALAIALHQTATTWESYKETINPKTEVTSWIPNELQKYVVPSPPRNPCMFNASSTLTRISNEDLKKMLHIRRSLYKMQLSILIYNELADRNIGAIIRNANVFNCEKVLVVNRKKFNKRGTLGTEKVTQLLFYSSTVDPEFQREINGYVVWLVYQHYPYTHLHHPFTHNGIEEYASSVPPDDKDFLRWCSTDPNPKRPHPLHGTFPHLRDNNVFLDDDESVSKAIREAFHKGFKGIMLAVPEEGATPHPLLPPLASKVVFIRSPKNLSSDIHRGLNGALSTAVALERLRKEINNLH